jgi:predicted  nucleic acid-binding Zn-ribbon protein
MAEGARRMSIFFDRLTEDEPPTREEIDRINARRRLELAMGLGDFAAQFKGFKTDSARTHRPQYVPNTKNQSDLVQKSPNHTGTLSSAKERESALEHEMRELTKSIRRLSKSIDKLMRVTALNSGGGHAD